jgi:putative AdoMet-dependent methyltransferase
MDKENRVQLFDEWAKSYDFSVQSANEFPFDGYERVLDRVVELSEPQSGMKVLDLGTGTGNLAERFIPFKTSIWGLDFSTEMLAKASEKVPQARFAQANLLGEWPTEFQQRYDCIVSAYVFHEFELGEKISLLQRLAECNLVAGGYFVIGDITFPTRALHEKAKKHIGNRWDEDEYYWVAEEVVCECEKKRL